MLCYSAKNAHTIWKQMHFFLIFAPLGVHGLILMPLITLGQSRGTEKAKESCKNKEVSTAWS